MSNANMVCSGAMCQCSFGNAPSTLSIMPISGVTTSGVPVALMTDNIFEINIKPFGMCSAPTNPAVIAASGAPVTCVPKYVAIPWSTSSGTVMVKGKPVLNQNSKLQCIYAGTITITNPGQTTVKVP